MKKIARLSLLLALSVVLNIVESMIPIFNGTIPGLKLGLANIVILFTLYKFSFKDSIIISLMRVLIVGLLRTGLFSISFFFSLGGAIFSIIVMYLIKKTNLFSIIGVSIIGSISHSIGQILISTILISTVNMFYYLPWILLFSIPTGIFTGILANQLLTNYDKIFTQKEGYL